MHVKEVIVVGDEEGETETIWSSPFLPLQGSESTTYALLFFKVKHSAYVASFCVDQRQWGVLFSCHLLFMD